MTGIYEPLTELPSIEDNKFIFQNQKAMFTYRTHIEKDKYIEWFIEKTKIEPKFIRLAHENGMNDPCTPYEHTHVLVDIGARFQTKNCRFFDYEEIHPHIAKIRTVNHFKKCKNYIAKEDIENEDLKEISTNIVLENLGNCKDIKEALIKNMDFNSRTAWSNVQGIKAAYTIMKKKPEVDIPELKNEWQTELEKELLGKPEKRKIIWYVDIIGGSGKTEFGKYMHANYPNKFITTKDLGTSRDASTIIKNEIENGWEQQGVIIDLPRTVEDHDKRIYTFIEDIKDGMLTATKYEGGIIHYNKPHVVIFANWEPRYEALSFDRWDVRFLEKGKLIEKTKLQKINKIENKIDNLSIDELKELILLAQKKIDILENNS